MTVTNTAQQTLTYSAFLAAAARLDTPGRAAAVRDERLRQQLQVHAAEADGLRAVHQRAARRLPAHPQGRPGRLQPLHAQEHQLLCLPQSGHERRQPRRQHPPHQARSN